METIFNKQLVYIKFNSNAESRIKININYIVFVVWLHESHTEIICLWVISPQLKFHLCSMQTELFQWDNADDISHCKLTKKQNHFYYNFYLLIIVFV